MEQRSVGVNCVQLPDKGSDMIVALLHIERPDLTPSYRTDTLHLDTKSPRLVPPPSHIPPPPANLLPLSTLQHHSGTWG